MKFLTHMRFDLVPPKPVDPPPPKPDPGKKAAANACEAAGGSCINLTPTNCANGAWADMKTHSCGSNDGLGCCMPGKGETAKAAATAPAKTAEPAKANPTATATAPAVATAPAAATGEAATVKPADTRDTTGFSAAPEPGADEKFSGSTLLVEAYAAIWLVMMSWLLLLWKKQQSLTSRLDGLESAIDRAEKRTAKPAVTKERPKEKEKAQENAS